MARLRVLLLGGFNLLRNGEPLPPIPSRAGRALFAYLVVNRGVPQPRERLAGEFWPDLPESKARRRLSHTLWQIQDALSELDDDGVAYLEATTSTLAFNANAPYWLDVEEFERGVERHRPSSEPRRRSSDFRGLERIVELYRGDFLSGYYEDWVLAEQERLRLLYMEALTWLVGLAKGHGAYSEALTYARLLTHHDPLREDAHREVMRLCVLLGRASEALRQYERVRSVLADELGAEPARATTKLYDKISRQRQIPIEPEVARSSVDDPPPLVERDTQQREVVESLEQALAGQGGVVLLEGDPGMGKSRLAGQAADDATWRAFTVLRGDCGPGRPTRPYGAIVDALKDELNPLRVEQLRSRIPQVLLSDLARLVPSVRQALGPGKVSPRLRDSEGAQRMREAVVATVMALASTSPTLMIIEDVHAADPETLQVLGLLAGQVPEHPLVLLLTYRSDKGRDRDETWQLLRTIDAGRSVPSPGGVAARRPRRLVVSPLTPFGTSEVIRTVLGEPPDPAATAILQRATGGNPLFLLETVRVLAEEGWQGDAEYLRDRDIPLASVVDEAIKGRLDTLPSDVHHVLVHAAVMSGDVDVRTLALACHRTGGDVADSVDHLRGRRLLVETTGGYAFQHGFARRVARERASTEELAAVHARVAEAIEQTHPEAVEQIAEHWWAAGRSESALEYLRRAATAAVEVHAYATAAEHHAKAFDLLERTPTSYEFRVGLLSEMESVLAILGQRDRQSEVLDRLTELASGRPDLEADAARRRAWLMAHTDRFAEAESAARTAVSIADSRGDAASLGEALVALGTTLTWEGRPELAVHEFGRAGEVLSEAAVPAADAWLGLGMAFRMLQRWAEAKRELQRAHDSYAEEQDPRGVAQALGQLAIVQVEAGDVAAGERAYLAAIQLSRDIGFRYGEAVNLVNLGTLLSFDRQIGRALETYEAAADAFRTLGHRRGDAFVCSNAGFAIHAMLGDDDRAAAETTYALDYFEEQGDRRHAAVCRATLASIAHRRGDYEAAERLCREGLAAIAQADDGTAAAGLHRTLAATKLERGDPDAALRHVDDAAAACRAAGISESRFLIDFVRVQALLAKREVGAAVESAMASVEALHRGVNRPHIVHYSAYLALQAADRWRAARKQLAAAHSTMQTVLESLGPELAAQSMARIPEHRDIAAAWEQSQPRRRTLKVAAAGAPTGRPLTDDEQVEIELAVELDLLERPEDLVEARRLLIIRLLDEAAEKGAELTVPELADLTGVSPATIRRDLRALREGGHDARTRGSRAE